MSKHHWQNFNQMKVGIVWFIITRILSNKPKHFFRTFTNSKILASALFEKQFLYFVAANQVISSHHSINNYTLDMLQFGPFYTWQNKLIIQICFGKACLQNAYQLLLRILIGDQECNSYSLECKVFSIHKNEIPIGHLSYVHMYTVILLTQYC